MKEEIYIMVTPGTFKHPMYIFSNNVETVPLVIETTAETLVKDILTNAKKYNITSIKIKGIKGFTLKFKEEIEKSSNLYFSNESINVELI